MIAIRVPEADFRFIREDDAPPVFYCPCLMSFCPVKSISDVFLCEMWFLDFTSSSESKFPEMISDCPVGNGLARLLN